LDDDHIIAIAQGPLCDSKSKCPKTGELLFTPKVSEIDQKESSSVFTSLQDVCEDSISFKLEEGTPVNHSQKQGKYLKDIVKCVLVETLLE
jgi:hypothetical protein